MGRSAAIGRYTKAVSVFDDYGYPRYMCVFGTNLDGDLWNWI
jgi:hypothetical protein